MEKLVFHLKHSIILRLSVFKFITTVELFIASG